MTSNTIIFSIIYQEGIRNSILDGFDIYFLDFALKFHFFIPPGGENSTKIAYFCPFSTFFSTKMANFEQKQDEHFIYNHIFSEISSYKLC